MLSSQGTRIEYYITLFYFRGAIECHVYHIISYHVCHVPEPMDDSSPFLGYGYRRSRYTLGAFNECVKKVMGSEWRRLASLSN